MAIIDPRFEKFRCDFIAHLSARFGLAPDVVKGRLEAWLLDPRRHQHELLAERSSVRPLRTRR
jgi:hypothetical protein